MQLDYELVFGIDKQMHLFSYLVISLIIGLMMIAFSDKNVANRRVGYIWMILVTFGVFEEYRQYLLPNRSAEFLDVVANMLGVSMGLGVAVLIGYVFRNRRNFATKGIVVYGIILIPLIVGLLFINERPFVTFDEPTQEKR
ncbi:VanZ family protein [Bacillaceae bacterium S4-13-58]